MQTGKLAVFRRIKSHPILKSVGAMASISLFFVAYFYVLEQPLAIATTMPALAVDKWMPVIPWSAWVYFSLWFYICAPVALIENRRAMLYYLGGAFVLSIVGLGIFFFFPTVVPDWNIDWSLYPTLEFLKNSDNAGNACPSLHVGFATYSGCWFVWLIRRLGLSPVWVAMVVLWGLAIIISTMTTKQHVLIDVIFGFLLGGLIFWMTAGAVRSVRLAI